ncbi:hypothetical protein P355_3956 [Burkholderia cenocepacia KC-01]|nr:hypothetical protein P355_3956 [Burkholderia cenocepacia KC-01]
MASVLQRKIRLVAIEDTQLTIDPIFEQSDSIVQHALALAEFHRKHNGAGYALDMLQPLLDYAEQIRAEAMLQAASMEAFDPMPPDIDI